LEVWVSNQAGASFRAAGNSFEVWFGDGSATARTLSRVELENLVAGTNDVTRHEVASATAARALAADAWRKDRALRLLLLLLDPSEPADEMVELAEALERLFAHPKAVRHCLNELSSLPLPTPNRASFALAQFATALNLTSLLAEIIGLQDNISLSRGALDELPDTLFDGLRDEFIEHAISVGAFYELAKAWENVANRQFAALRIGSQLRGATPQAQQVALAWAAISKPDKRRAQIVEEDSDADDRRANYIDSPVGRSGYERFQNVRAQQREIVERLRSGDVSSARTFVDQLVAQQSHDNLDFVVKSLCNMAQEAKHLGMLGLDLEWSSWAVRLLPTDAWAQGQMADALIAFGRFDEARAALEIAKSTYPSFVATSNARILRRSGDLEGALKAYLDARDDFPDAADAHYAWAGVAEVHRDLGNLDMALEIYDEAVGIFSGNSAILSGRAAVLSDMGRFHDALQSLSRSLAVNRGDIVSLNGIASVYRNNGDLDEALNKYNDILRKFPEEPASLSGRAEVLRRRGELELASADYQKLIDLFPFMDVGYVGRGRTLVAQGLYVEALNLYSDAMARFPTSQGIIASAAALKVRVGDWYAALALYDRLTTASPRNLRARLGKIRVLNRMHQPSQALDETTAVLALAPQHREALNEKATALFELGKFQEVLEITQVHSPHGEAQWAALFIRAMSLAQIGRSTEADRLLRQGVSSPIDRVRRYASSGLAVLKLRANNLNAARKVVDGAPGEASSLVKFHVSAALRQSSAIVEYNQTTPADAAGYVEVREEISRRFRLIEGGQAPVHSREWIFDAETRLLIFDATSDENMLLAA
jgi:tetratricopeptide (TPR) repeat protein